MGAAKKTMIVFVGYIYYKYTLIFLCQMSDIQIRCQKTESGKEAKIHGTKENCSNYSQRGKQENP